MGSETPKQFMLLKGEPVLFHTMRAFHSFDPSVRMIIVLSEEHHQKWKDLCEEHVIYAPHEVVAGGAERYHSVKAGLEQLTEEGIVAIHDGVRPILSRELLQRCFDEAEEHSSAIPVVPLSSSIREIQKDGSRAIDRSQLRMVQTPQCFKVQILRKAFDQPYDEAFTDEATLVERSGVKVHLVEGEEQNLKITTPLDLRMAEGLLA